jgi:Protein of unknown function (DUF3300)
MWLRKAIASVLIGAFWFWSLTIPQNVAYGQVLPTPDQLDQLLAPVALYPDALLAQVCAASTDPQQILDADKWLNQNLNLNGQARTDAAQNAGFDPAFIALMNFPQVLDMMAQNINDYATIGQAFAADQGSVMASVQRLRQQAYASGVLQSNQYQNVDVQSQGGSQVVVIQPANPQVVFVPQYNPTVVYAAPSTGAIVAASALSFGAGIALGSWLTGPNYPWGWGGWGWNWGRNTVIVNNNYWAVNNRYRPRYRTYQYRPPSYNRPIHARPPANWNNRPYYRPVSGGRPPGYRPGTTPPAGGRPGNRPPSNGGRPPATNPGNRPGNPPAGARPGNRPPSNGGRPPATNPANRPGNPPAGARPGNRPPSNGGRPPATNPGNRPANPPAGARPGNRPPSNAGRPPATNPGNRTGNRQSRPANPPSNRSNQQRPSQGRQPSSRPTTRPQRPPQNP